MNRIVFFLLLSLSFGFGQCSQSPNDDFFNNYWDTLDDSEKDEGVYQDMRSLTNDFRSLPSSDDLNRHINGQLTPQMDLCAHTRSIATVEGDFPAAEGARRVLATIFQSCIATERVITAQTPNLAGVRSSTNINGRTNPHGGRLRQITNPTAYAQSHIVLSELLADPNYPQAPHCRDMNLTPPVYGYGSRLTRSRESGRINLFTSGTGVITPPAAVGNDCSTFISAALATAGLRVRKTGAAFQDTTTRGFHDLAGAANSCIGHAEFDSEHTIRPGDMVNVAGNHIIMIDSISEDPLGIKARAENNSCASLSIADFDFTYIHSGAMKGSYGPSRVHSSTHNGGTIFNNLLVTARAQCQRLARGNSDNVSARSLNGTSTFGILRHDSLNPECRLPERVQLEGEECVEECFQNTSSDA